MKFIVSRITKLSARRTRETCVLIISCVFFSSKATTTLPPTRIRPTSVCCFRFQLEGLHVYEFHIDSLLFNIIHELIGNPGFSGTGLSTHYDQRPRKSYHLQNDVTLFGESLLVIREKMTFLFLPQSCDFWNSESNAHFSLMFVRASFHLLNRLSFSTVRTLASAPAPTLFEKIADKKIPSDMIFQDDMVRVVALHES